jgi:hypothetical protein
VERYRGKMVSQVHKVPRALLISTARLLWRASRWIEHLGNLAFLRTLRTSQPRFHEKASLFRKDEKG